MCLDFLNLNEEYSELNLTNAQLRKYLGLEPDKYTRPTDLHNRILKRVAKDINEESDIDLTIIPNREGSRKIVGFKFEFRIKPENLDFYRPGAVMTPKQSHASHLENIFAKVGFNHDEASRNRISEICNKVGEKKAEEILIGVLNKYKKVKQKDKSVRLGLLRFFFEQDSIFVENFEDEVTKESAELNKFIDKYIDIILDEFNLIYDSLRFDLFSEELSSNFEQYIEDIILVVEQKPVLKKLFTKKGYMPSQPDFLADKFIVRNLLGTFKIPLKIKSKEDIYMLNQRNIFESALKNISGVPHLASYVSQNKINLKEIYDQIQQSILEKLN